MWTGGVDRASLVQGTLCFDFHQEDVCAPLWDEHTCESREKARIRAPWRGYSQSRLKQRAGPSLPDATANSAKNTCRDDSRASPRGLRVQGHTRALTAFGACVRVSPHTHASISLRSGHLRAGRWANSVMGGQERQERHKDAVSPWSIIRRPGPPPVRALCVLHQTGDLACLMQTFVRGVWRDREQSSGAKSQHLISRWGSVSALSGVFLDT